MDGVGEGKRKVCVPAAWLAWACAGMLVGTATGASAQGLPGAGRGADPDCGEGLRLYQAQKYEAAEPLLRRCLERGEALPPLIALAAISSLAGRPADTRALAQRAVAIDSSSVEARYWLGRGWLEGGQKDQARREWERALTFSAEHPGVLEGLARLAMDRGETAKAYGLLTQLQRVGVDDGWLHRLLADLARRKGLWADALRHWRDALARDGEDAKSLLTAGELAILAGDTSGAVAACRRAVELEPAAPSYGGLGEALFAAHRYQEAVDPLRRALELAPDEARHHFNLANVLELLDRAEEADQHFRRCLELDPADRIARFNYGIHLEKLGRLQEALRQVDRVVAEAPRMLEAQVVRGQLLEQLGRYEDAVAAVDTVMARDAENRPRLQAWRENLLEKIQGVAAAARPGQIHLLYIVTGDTAAARRIEQELASGVDFAQVAVRYSSGPKAELGGDIGWIDPADMVEPLRSAIEALAIDQASPPVRARGLVHFFKRVR